MIIGHPRKINNIEVHEPLTLNDSDIKRVTNTKSLGIIVDEGLNWERQTIHNKSRGGFQSLRRLKSILPQSSLSNVHRALVESHIRYSDAIWGSLSNTKIDFFVFDKHNKQSFFYFLPYKYTKYSKQHLNVIKISLVFHFMLTGHIVNQSCTECISASKNENEMSLVGRRWVAGRSPVSHR